MSTVLEPPGTTMVTVGALFALVLGPELAASPIRPDDDFFDRGGDSVLAASLLLEIEAKFGVALPVDLLFDHPTPAAIAAAIDAAEAIHRPDTAAGSANAVFLIPGVHGIAHLLRPLAGQIDLPGAIHILQAPGLDGASAPLDSVEALAAHYRAQIRAIQPVGMVGLVGYSMGGLIAFAVAQMMVQAGEPPPMLVLLDTMIPRRQWPRAAILHLWARRLRHHGRRIADIPRRDMLAWIRGRMRAAARDFDASPGDEAARLPEPLRAVYVAGRYAGACYRPRNYSGTVHFIEAGAGWWPTHPDIVWRRVARSLVIHKIAVSHSDMIRDGADVLGALITKIGRSVMEID